MFFITKPPGTKALSFSRDVFLFRHRTPSSHGRETLPRDRYLAEFYDKCKKLLVWNSL